jgi:hypothetical protein
MNLLSRVIARELWYMLSGCYASEVRRLSELQSRAGARDSIHYPLDSAGLIAAIFQNEQRADTYLRCAESLGLKRFKFLRLELAV